MSLVCQQRRESLADPIFHKGTRVAEDANRFLDDNTVTRPIASRTKLKELRVSGVIDSAILPDRFRDPGFSLPRRTFLVRDGGNRSGQHARATWCVL